MNTCVPTCDTITCPNGTDIVSMFKMLMFALRGKQGNGAMCITWRNDVIQYRLSEFGASAQMGCFMTHGDDLKHLKGSEHI